MRDDNLLATRLNQIWQMLFPEVERKNNIIIRFKGRWKNKFGHIKLLRSKETEIAVNSHFKNEAIPEYLIDITITHELVHYMHGFNSPLERRFKHPHKGNIVNRELIARGFGSMLKKEKEFIKNEWHGFIKNNHKEKNFSRNPFTIRKFFKSLMQN